MNIFFKFLNRMSNNNIVDEINELIDIASNPNERYEHRVDAAATLRVRHYYTSDLLRNSNVSENVISASGEDREEPEENMQFENNNNRNNNNRNNNNRNNNSTITLENRNQNSNNESVLSKDNINWNGGVRLIKKAKKNTCKSKKSTRKTKKSKKSTRKTTKRKN